MVTIEEIIGHPLTLLLIGAGVSSLVIPWITNKWQDHKKKLEIKVDIVSKMSEEISYQLGNAALSLFVKKTAFTDAEYNAYNQSSIEWFIKVNITRSKLQSYYPDTNIAEKWDDYCFILNDIESASRNYFDQNPKAKKELEHELAIIKDDLSDDESINWNDLTAHYNDELWWAVVRITRNRGDEIIGNVLKSPIRAF